MFSVAVVLELLDNAGLAVVLGGPVEVAVVAPAANAGVVLAEVEAGCVPSIIAARVCWLRNSLSFSRALRTLAIFLTTGSYDDISASLSNTKAKLNIKALR